MSLEMYLIKRKKYSPDDERQTEVAYWRKANQIRAWFSNNLNGFADRGETLVPKEKLEDLLSVCKTVASNRSRPISEEMLPTSVGVFFGSGAYDRWYYQTVDYTVKRVQEILDTTDFVNCEVVYWEWY